MTLRAWRVCAPTKALQKENKVAWENISGYSGSTVDDRNIARNQSSNTVQAEGTPMSEIISQTLTTTLGPETTTCQRSTVFLTGSKSKKLVLRLVAVVNECVSASRLDTAFEISAPIVSFERLPARTTACSRENNCSKGISRFRHHTIPVSMTKKQVAHSRSFFHRKGALTMRLPQDTIGEC